MEGQGHAPEGINSGMLESMRQAGSGGASGAGMAAYELGKGLKQSVDSVTSGLGGVHLLETEPPLGDNVFAALDKGDNLSPLGLKGMTVLGDMNFHGSIDAGKIGVPSQLNTEKPHGLFSRSAG